MTWGENYDKGSFKPSMPMEVLDKLGKPIGVFESARAASRILGFDAHTLIRLLKSGKRGRSGVMKGLRVVSPTKQTQKDI